MNTAGGTSIYLIFFVILFIIVLAIFIIGFMRVGKRQRGMGTGAPRIHEGGQPLKAGEYEPVSDPRGDDIGGNFANVSGSEDEKNPRNNNVRQ